MIFIIDIDNTICITKKSDYNSSIPIMSRIQQINKLYDYGNTIIYWTARGSNSGKDWTDFTIKQLDNWGCKRHSIRMNKPVYDYWIDDKSIILSEFFDD